LPTYKTSLHSTIHHSNFYFFQVLNLSECKQNKHDEMNAKHTGFERHK
jgi:hypothetical protein